MLLSGGSDSKESACNAGYVGSISGLRRWLWVENGNPLRHSCLGNPMERGAWWATVHASAFSLMQQSTQEFFIYSERKSLRSHMICQCFPPFHGLFFHFLDGLFWGMSFFLILAKFMFCYLCFQCHIEEIITYYKVRKDCLYVLVWEFYSFYSLDRRVIFN